MRANGVGVAAVGVSFLASIASAGLAGIGQLGTALLCAAIAAFALIVAGIKLVHGFNNLFFVFLLFHLLYGVSGPLNALYGEPMAPIFSYPYETGPFLIAFAAASVGLSLALLLGATVLAADDESRALLDVDARTLGLLALTLAACASLLELSNLARVGVGAVFEGKASYQSAVDALTLTAPSYEVARVAVALYALFLAQKKAQHPPQFFMKGYGKLFLLSLLPLLLISLVLGRRGPLLDWVFLFIVGSTWYEARQKVSRGVATGLLLTYLAMGMLFANRATLAYSFYVGDFSILADHVRQPEVIVSGLNPGANEFGAAFGNFSEYYKYDVSGPQYGRTYLEGFAMMVPSFLYPGTKPQPVAYAFRDQYFPGVESQGAIASTAYSSILEAFVNFRLIGVAIVYFAVGLVMVALERARKRSSSIAYALIYLSILPSAIVFHRADFGASVVSPIFFALLLVLMTLTLLRVTQLLRMVSNPGSVAPATHI